MKAYPHLKVEYGYLFGIADLYRIDLSKANHALSPELSQVAGQVEPDINLDIVALIDKWQKEEVHRYGLRHFIENGLLDWGFEPREIKTTLDTIARINWRAWN